MASKAPKRRAEAASKPAKPSKAYKEAEKIFNKQTDKTEVNKYMLVSIDPEVISSPPGIYLGGSLIVIFYIILFLLISVFFLGGGT